MIKLENTEVIGFEAAIRGMRNPMNSWDKSDSGCEETSMWDIGGDPIFTIGENDHNLMMNLATNGSIHAKYRRMINVYVDITAPLYWWKEFDTYKVGTVANSCSTMHKIEEKEFDLGDFSCEHLSCWGAPTRREPNRDIYDEQAGEFVFDYLGALQGIIIALNGAREQYLKRGDKKLWWQMIQLLPSSYNQRRTIMLNYEVLAGIYESRREHKLDEWREFCRWIKEELPYSEVITAKEERAFTPNEIRAACGLPPVTEETKEELKKKWQ